MGDLKDRWLRNSDRLRSTPEYAAEALSGRIAMKIHEKLASAGLTQKDLSKRLGVSPSYVSQLLGGQPNMTLQTLAALSQALGFTVDIVLGNAETPAPTVADATEEECVTSTTVAFATWSRSSKTGGAATTDMGLYVAREAFAQ